MPQNSHHYLLRARFGPADLLKILNKLMAENKNHPDAPDFDFDYIKRKIEISARTRCTAEDLLEALVLHVEKQAGSGLLLPGAPQPDRGERDKPLEGKDARVRIPIGVLVQTPDVYAEVLVNALQEYGVRGIVYEHDGDGFAIPQTRTNVMLDYTEIIGAFPLPGYLELVEEKG